MAKLAPENAGFIRDAKAKLPPGRGLSDNSVASGPKGDQVTKTFDKKADQYAGGKS